MVCPPCGDKPGLILIQQGGITLMPDLIPGVGVVLLVPSSHGEYGKAPDNPSISRRVVVSRGGPAPLAGADAGEALETGARMRWRRTVSALSSAVWAVAIRSAPTARAASLQKGIPRPAGGLFQAQAQALPPRRRLLRR